MPKGQPLEKNPNWKGGRTVDPRGYVLLKLPGHPGADVRGYVYEHRLVAEESLGRPLQQGELVHHKDGDTSNNHPANLEVVGGNAEHFARHRKRLDLREPEQPNPEIMCQCGCGETLLQFDRWNRPRRFVSGHNGRAGTGRFAG